MLVLVRLQHIQCFFIGERGVIDIMNAELDAFLDRFLGPGMGGKAASPAAGLVTSDLDFIIGELIFFSPHARNLFPRQVQLDRINAPFHQNPNIAAHVFNARYHNAQVKAFMINMRQGCIPQAPDRSKLRPGGGIAWARHLAGPNGVTDYDIQTWLSCRRPAASGEACIEHDFGHIDAIEHMLFNRHHLNGIDPRRIVPA